MSGAVPSCTVGLRRPGAVTAMAAAVANLSLTRRRGSSRDGQSGGWELRGRIGRLERKDPRDTHRQMRGALTADARGRICVTRADPLWFLEWAGMIQSRVAVSVAMAQRMGVLLPSRSFFLPFRLSARATNRFLIACRDCRWDCADLRSVRRSQRLVGALQRG